MRVGRAVVGGRPDFVVQDGDGPWVAAASIGFHLDDTAALIDASDALRAAVVEGKGQPLGADLALECPIVRPSKVIGIGLNYAAHARENGSELPASPRVFAKFPNALNGPSDPIAVDRSATAEPDYECELAVVIGRRTRRVTPDRALSCAFGYAVANDVSARDRQRRDVQISLSKSFDTFCPIGPWLTTADEVPEPQSRWIRTWVNAEPRQDSTTADMIFSVAALVAFLSETMTLEAGDVILTGTPEGVGMGMDPPRFLEAGDLVVCEIEGLGRLENAVVG